MHHLDYEQQVQRQQEQQQPQQWQQDDEQDLVYRNLQWPGETATLGPTTSTMELLHGPQLLGEPSSSGKAPKQKRTRSALSCAECRRLKLRCSREPWPCTNCVKRKCSDLCPEETVAPIRPSRTKEVGALLERIRELEYHLAEVSAHQEAVAQEPSSQYQNYGQPSTSYLQNPSSNQPSTSTSNSAPVEEHHPGVADVSEVMGTLLLGDDGSSRYLGKSAANALFHDAGSDDEDAASVGSEEEDEAAYNLSMRLQGTSFPMVSKGLEVEDFQAMLPPISAARFKADCYYKNCAHMFEPLKREVFDKHLADAYDFGAEEPLPLEQLALVFMVLALGISFDLHADIKDPRSPKYHSIAQACLTSAKFLNVPSLASIQCLHLMSTWQLTFHSQTGAFRAWPLLGLAGRMVLSTGIHRDGSIWAIPEPYLTIRRNLFWEIVSYDRLQSLILGRPYMLNSKHWDAVMPEPPPGQSIEGQPLEYSRAKWQFAMLVGDLCDDCLSVGRPAYETILMYDRKIRAFKESLPAWLVFDAKKSLSTEPVQQGSEEQRQLYQNHSMTVMLNETLLFLHRVAFANAIEHYSIEPLRSPWAQSVVSLCLEASRTLIAVARSAYTHYPKLAARWWHIQCHAFGAGVCFAAVCIKSPASALTRLAWNELTDAVNLLENLAREGGHARDLYPRLRKLRDQAQAKLESHQNSNDPSSDAPHISHMGGEHGVESRGSGFAANSETMAECPLAKNAGGKEHGHHHIKEEDGELAVLGAATRKLEGNFVQRHQVARTHSSGTGAHLHREHHHAHPPSGLSKKDLSPTTSTRTGSSSTPHGRSREQTTFSPSDAVPPPSATTTTFFGQSPITSSGNEQQQQQLLQQQGLSYPLSPYSATNPSTTSLQVYDNLDPGLAELLASISGTSASRSQSVDDTMSGNISAVYAVQSTQVAAPAPVPVSLPVPSVISIPAAGPIAGGQPLFSQLPPAHAQNQSSQMQSSRKDPRATAPSSPVRMSFPGTGIPHDYSGPMMNYDIAGSFPSSEHMGSQAVSGPPSQYSSPSYEHFERHPSISREGYDSAAAGAVPIHAVPAPGPGSAIPRPGTTLGEDNYLDTAWMDYFPTPGVGLFQQQAPAPAPPSYPLPSPVQQQQHQAQQMHLHHQQQQQQQLLHHRQQQQQQQQQQEELYFADPQVQQQQQLRFQQQHPQQRGYPIPSRQQQQQAMSLQQMQMQQQQQQQQRYYGETGPQDSSGYRQYDELLGTLSGPGAYRGRQP